MPGKTFAIEMLPAREGDCLWIEYGNPAQPNIILCDGGRKSAYQTLRPKLRRLAEANQALELLILTHIDADHIEGILELFRETEFEIKVKDVWFNGYQHLKLAEKDLVDRGLLGARQAEILTHALIAGGYPWNAAFAGNPVARGEYLVPVVELEGGMRLSILSPDYESLANLISSWDEQCSDAGIDPGFGFAIAPPAAAVNEAEDELLDAPPIDVDAAAAERFQRDRSDANRSSLAILAEFDGHRLLLAGDAHADVMMDGLRQVSGNSVDRIELDAFKLSHHGSKGTSPRELFAMVDAKSLLISTDHSRHAHPDRQTIARWALECREGGRLCFNYRQPEALFWGKPSLRERFGIEVLVPDADRDGLSRFTII